MMRSIVYTTLLLFNSCLSPGLLYTDITRPLCTDLRGTNLGTKTVSASTKRIDIPTPRIDLTAEWDSKAIGDIAKSNGLKTVHSCDERTQSILLGIFRRDEILIYGE